MPVRSLNSSVLRWPDWKSVDASVRIWAKEVAEKKPEVIRIGYFGSYARGNWGVGSDVDIIIVVEKTDLPQMQRTRHYDATALPLPADVIVYTEAEYDSILHRSRFGEMLKYETVWVYERKP